MARGAARGPGGGKRWEKKEPTLANIRATDAEVARWKLVWGHPESRLYLGWIDPFPMPPGKPCKPCGGGIRFWCEDEAPRRGWRCCNCHPAPPQIMIRHWTIDDPVDAAERDAIAAEAPERISGAASAALERKPRTATGGGVWLDEPETEQKEDDWI